MVISIDPDSRKVAMPTPDQMQRLSAIAKRGTLQGAHPAPVHHADGRISLDVRSWMRDYSVAKIGPDGKLTTSCVESKEAAQRAFQAPAAPPARMEDR